MGTTSLCSTCTKADCTCPIWSPSHKTDSCVEYLSIVENECCEGGDMTSACYHDHCEGPREIRVTK